jgi:glutamate synthase domain-containing protein 2
MHWLAVTGIVLLIGLVVLVAYDVLQRKHAILHNFPVVGHFRYWLESIGPELRQYIVTSNNEERPFSRDERRWVYASAKKQNNYFGFGTDHDLERSPNYLIIRHSAFPLNEPQAGDEDYDPNYRLPCAKVVGEPRQRAKAFRPESVVNISAMSFGSLSATAIEALNRGAKLAGCLQNTGEGGVSNYHLHGGELIWQIGTGYFGCRDEHGRFDVSRFRDVVAANPVRAIELKLSQGAKPGRGGLLPAAKITPEIARIRGVPVGEDCASAASHTAFHCVDSMLDFVEQLADESGLPIGIKSAVGQMDFWTELTKLMTMTERGVDFVTIDGGEGGTGAAPLVFSDHVALPFKLGMSAVYRTFFEAGLHQKVCFIGSGKLGFPETALLAFGLGCDLINVGREAMLAIGCIQAQRCHTGHCPAGIATQSRWLMNGLKPTDKAARLANYVVTLRKELLQLSRACGVEHPAFMSTDHFEVLDECFFGRSATECFGYPASSETNKRSFCGIDAPPGGIV